MKRGFIIAVLLAFIAMSGLAQAITWEIVGTVANAAPTDTLLVLDAEKRIEIATLQVKNGNIIPTRGTLDKPTICCIAKQGRSGWIRMFVLENGTIRLYVDLDLVYLIEIGGTPMNDELMALLAVQNKDMDIDTYFRKMYEVVSHIVSNHPNHPLSPYLIGQCQMTFKPSETIELIERLSPNLRLSPKMDRLKDHLSLAQETEEGKMFKELTGVSPDGKPVAISDFVGHGNYMLADFWALWCAPCKADIPNVIALYEKYKGKGLKVIGITVNDTPEKSDSVVRMLGIPFPQIYESKPMGVYGVNGIPHKILFAPDGIILSRRIVSCKELDKKLTELFDDK